MSRWMWACEWGYKVNIDRQQYKKLEYLTAVLLMIQVFWDVTVLLGLQWMDYITERFIP